MDISIDITQLIGQIFIGVGYAIFIISRFLKKKSSMLLWDNISRVTDILGYILFGNVNSLEHTVFGIVRNEAYRRIKTPKVRNLVYIGLLIVIGIMYGIAFSGISTVLLIVSNVINLTGTAYGDEQGVRLGTICAGVCNITAFVLIANYAGSIGEGICLVMTLFAYMIYARNKAGGSPKEDEP